MKKNILIIGGGAMGQVMKKLLTENSKEARVFDTQTERSEIQRDVFEQTYKEADVIFLCVASEVSATILSEHGALCKAGAIIVAIAKGLSDDGEYMHEVIAARAQRARALILAGPLLAQEIMEEKPTHGVCASADAEAQKELSSLLMRPYFSLSETDDIKGIATASVLKNCYTMLLGIAEGCDVGANARGVLFEKSVAEMAELVKREGGRRESAYGAAGMADLYASAGSITSRNHLCGLTLGRESACSKACEGARSALLLEKRLPSLPPILRLFTDILKNPHNTCTRLSEAVSAS